MKKSTCFILGSVVGGGVLGFIGLVNGMVMPFMLADQTENHCIYWRRIKNGREVDTFYGNRELFPEMNKEETSE